MKYIVTAKNGTIIDRRTFVNNPLENEKMRFPEEAIAHEVSDAKADEIMDQLEGLEPGERLSFDGTNLTHTRAVDAVDKKPFARQLKIVLNGVKPKVRRRIIDVIGPGYALDDPQAMADALMAVDASGLPDRLKVLRSDILTVIGREVTKRSNIT